VNGYDKIPSKGSYAGVSQPMVRDPHNGLHFLRNLLVGMGFRQCYSNSLQTESISKINGNSIKLMNPHSDTMTHLRTSLIPGLIDSLNMNVNNHVQDIQLFECGSVHHQVKNERKETIKLSGIVFGNFMSNSIHKESQSQAHSLFTIKGHLESILKKLCMNNYKIEKEVNPLFSPGFKLMYKKSTVGYFGKISNKLITEMVTKDIYDVLGFELCTKPFMDCLDKINQYKPISKFPKMEREINFVTKNSLDSGKISTLIKNSGKGLIKSIIPVNLYRHDSLGNDKKSIVFKLIFQSETKTLIDQDVNSIIDQIIKKVSSSFDVELRA
jgi:phenylalanyl-tRNA synthetase beta chain